MHLLALGAFWHNFLNATLTVLEQVLMHLLALGAFWLDPGPEMQHDFSAES